MMSVQGWEWAPLSRGTFDILWSCCQTIGLCAWSSICVNVPSPDAVFLDILSDKLNSALLTLVGPDLVFLLAFSQLQFARASVKQFKDTKHEGWTLTHAYYANMGGIAVVPKDWKRFPVDVRQLHYLIAHGYSEYPRITLKEIKARGKTDELGRAVTIGQCLIFTLTIPVRCAHGLVVTTLELTTLGFVFCTLAIAICWWHKPNDVELGHTFELDTSMEEILRAAGKDANGTYRDTPLDFVSRERWAGNILWLFYVNILRKMGLFPDRHKERPIQKFSSLLCPS